MKKTIRMAAMALSALLCFATTGAYAEVVNVKFEASGNSTIIENVELPHTFICNYSTANGEFDQVLRELYGWAFDPDNLYCYFEALTSSDGDKVDAKLDNLNGHHTFTISSAFEGKVTVTGKYSIFSSPLPYSVDISTIIPTYTVTLNDGGVDAAKWTAKAGEGDYQALPVSNVVAGTTVTVKYDGDREVKSVKAVEKTVNGSGTQSDPFNVAGAVAYIDAMQAAIKAAQDAAQPEPTFPDVYVKGKISAILYTYNTTYGTGTFWISDDGTAYGVASDKKSTTEPTKDFECYSVYWFGPENAWTDGSVQPEVGDEVIIKGQLTFYNNSIYESASKKAWIYSLNGKDERTGESVVAEGSDLTPTENANEWTFTMPAEDVELQVAYYTEDELAALAVDALIADIGEVAYTDECKALIDAARAAYDALTDAQKALVDADTLSVLTDAETGYADLEAADAVIALIDAIGEVAYTDECKALIDAAREAYDALTDAQKDLVTNCETLTAAEAAYADLEAAAEFDAYKTEQIAVVEALAQDGDSEDATALIAAAKADIEALAFDSAKTLEENKAAVDAIVAKLIEDLAACRSVIVDVIIDAETETDIEVTPGQPYTDEVIAALTEAAQATATRHGKVVTGWQNVDGSEVTGQTVAKAGDKLTAVWETVNPLVPETLGAGAVNNAKAVAYDAYVLDADGNAYGTVKVTVGKVNRKTGLSSVKAVVKPYIGGYKTFKATEAKGGKATVYSDEASVVELANKSNLMTLVIGKEGVAGYCTIAGAAYEINGSRNRVKTDKASYDFWKGARAAVFTSETGAIVATFSFEVKPSGKVSVKGRFANGKTTSGTARLMVADNGEEACVAIKGSKKLPFSAVVWFGENGETTVESIETSIANGVACAAVGGAGSLLKGIYTFQTGDLAIPLRFNGKKFISGDAEVSYKAATGVFSGSFNERYMNAKGRAKTSKVKFGGVFVDGIGYGTTKSGADVTIVPAAE